MANHPIDISVKIRKITIRAFIIGVHHLETSNVLELGAFSFL